MDKHLFVPDIGYAFICMEERKMLPGSILN